MKDEQDEKEYRRSVYKKNKRNKIREKSNDDQPRKHKEPYKRQQVDWLEEEYE